jgi:hypothetical protein
MLNRGIDDDEACRKLIADFDKATKGGNLFTK